MANGRKNRNFIHSLQVDGAQLEDPWDLGKAFAAYFNRIFALKKVSWPKVDFRKLFAFKPYMDLT